MKEKLRRDDRDCFDAFPGEHPSDVNNMVANLFVLMQAARDD